MAGLYLHSNPEKYNDLKAVSSFVRKNLKAEIKERKAGDASHDASIVEIKDELARLTAKVKLWSENKSTPTAAVVCMELAMNGDMVLREHAEADEDVKASDLNAAAAGTFKTYFQVYLETADKERHVWVTHEPVVTLVSTVVDTDVTDPGFTIEDRDAAPAIPNWQRGKLKIAVTWDTDAGATKVYAAADKIVVTVKVATDDKLLGWSIAVVTKTFNVV